MSKRELSKILKREFEVAFSKNAQPLWLRILKYAIILVFVYFFWENPLFWIILCIVLLLALLLHFWYRYKTESWTKSYKGWDYEKNKSKLE